MGVFLYELNREFG